MSQIIAPDFSVMTNNEYHANKTHLSSSSLKTILKSPETFYRENVLGNREQISKPAFDEGSFTHTLILEPSEVAQYAIYDGLRRAGDRWEAFKADNKGKTILSAPQVARCHKYYEAYTYRPEAVQLLSGGFAEHSMVSQVLGVPVKVRADYINVELGYIADVKTTSSPTGSEVFQQVMRDFRYDLSAALYAQVAFDNYGKLFDFYFVVISKADMTCEVYKASSSTLSEGSALVTQAVVLYRQCMQSGLWQHSQPKLVIADTNYEIVEV